MITAREIRVVRWAGNLFLELAPLVDVAFEGEAKAPGARVRDLHRYWRDGQALLKLADKLSQARKAQAGKARGP